MDWNDRKYLSSIYDVTIMFSHTVIKIGWSMVCCWLVAWISLTSCTLYLISNIYFENLLGGIQCWSMRHRWNEHYKIFITVCSFMEVRAEGGAFLIQQLNMDCNSYVVIK